MGGGQGWIMRMDDDYHYDHYDYDDDDDGEDGDYHYDHYDYDDVIKQGSVSHLPAG